MLRACLRLLTIACLCSGVLVGCGSSQAEPTDPTAVTKQRLQGTWVLTSFALTSGLEAPLEGLLDAQLNQMTITFDRDSYAAHGPGVNVSGRFEVVETNLNQFSGNVYTPAGGPYRVMGRFEGSWLHFTSTTSPWSGNGTLIRQQ